MKDEFMPLIRQIIEERNRLAVTLTAMEGITVFTSSANFLLIKTEKRQLKLVHISGEKQWQ